MRILLVGQDTNLLAETRRTLWREHRGWEAISAATGAEALQFLGRDPVDILVSDMSLPDMTGAELFHEVRGIEPGIVRIALADHAMAEWEEKAEGDLHRLFVKPVSAAFLQGVIESLCIEDDDTSVRSVRAFVGGLDRIPSLPSLYSELLALLQRQDVGMGEVARLIRKDLGIAAQVLKVANSVHCAADRPVREIGQAAAMLGIDSLRSLVLFRGLISGIDSPRPQGLDLEQLWHHSFQVATGVRKLAVFEGETQLADLAFSVGLLHDIGLVVLATDPNGRYHKVLAQAQTTRIPLAVLEHEVYGVDHTQVGAHLLNLWGLPPSFCRPVREHHAPPLVEAGFPLSAALHLADVRHGGGTNVGLFADGRWGLHPHVLADSDRFSRWKACLSGGAESGA